MWPELDLGGWFVGLWLQLGWGGWVIGFRLKLGWRGQTTSLWLRFGWASWPISSRIDLGWGGWHTGLWSNLAGEADPLASGLSLSGEASWPTGLWFRLGWSLCSPLSPAISSVMLQPMFGPLGLDNTPTIDFHQNITRWGLATSWFCLELLLMFHKLADLCHQFLIKF